MFYFYIQQALRWTWREKPSLPWNWIHHIGLGSCLSQHQGQCLSTSTQNHGEKHHFHHKPHQSYTCAFEQTYTFKYTSIFKTRFHKTNPTFYCYALCYFLPYLSLVLSIPSFLISVDSTHVHTYTHIHIQSHIHILEAWCMTFVHLGGGVPQPGLHSLAVQELSRDVWLMA